MRRTTTQLALAPLAFSAVFFVFGKPQNIAPAAYSSPKSELPLQHVGWSSASFGENDLPCLPLKRERSFRVNAGLNPDNAYMMMAASYIAYSFWPGKRERILSSWGFREINIFDSERHSTNGYWASHDDFVVLALRGTQEPTDLFTDLSVQLEPFALPGVKGAQVHSGFLSSAQSVHEKFLEAQRSAKARKVPLFITGHSLGGAVALLGALKLITHDGVVDAVWTFGLPKVGNNSFYDAAKKMLGSRWHHINQTVDPIPMLPFSQLDAQKLQQLAANYGDYLPLLNRFATNASYWEHTGKKSDDPSQQSVSVLNKKLTNIARGFWKHIPRSYVCDLADGSLKAN